MANPRTRRDDLVEIDQGVWSDGAWHTIRLRKAGTKQLANVPLKVSHGEARAIVAALQDSIDAVDRMLAARDDAGAAAGKPKAIPHIQIEQMLDSSLNPPANAAEPKRGPAPINPDRLRHG